MTFIINLGRVVLNFIYSILKLLPQKKKILFMSRQSNCPSLDIMAISTEFKLQHPDYEVVILCKTLDGGILNKIKYCFHMLRQMYHLATARIVVIDSYAILVSLLHHRNTLLIVQIWHSVGTMKKFAYSILDKPEGSSSKLAHAMHMHENYDYVLCAGEGYIDHLAEGFNIDKSKIKILPLPRVEFLQKEEYAKTKRELIYSTFPELKEKKNILYVPTFRKEESEQARFVDAVQELSEALSPYKDKYNLVIKAHPLSHVASKYNTFSSFDMLFIADYIISDYSCIMYEGAILHKPLFFYTYDYEDYMSKRDIYMDYPSEIPNTMYDNAKDLVQGIISNNFDMAKQEKFLSKYVNWQQDNIIKSIVEFLWDNRK